MARLPKIDQGVARMSGTGETWIRMTAQWAKWPKRGRRVTVYRRTEDEALDALMEQIKEDIQ